MNSSDGTDMPKKVCGAKRTYEGIEHICHRKPSHTRRWHQNEAGDFRWKPDINRTPRFKVGTPDVGVVGLARLLMKMDATKSMTSSPEQEEGVERCPE